MGRGYGSRRGHEKVEIFFCFLKKKIVDKWLWYHMAAREGKYKERESDSRFGTVNFDCFLSLPLLVTPKPLSSALPDIILRVKCEHATMWHIGNAISYPFQFCVNGVFNRCPAFKAWFSFSTCFWTLANLWG